MALIALTFTGTTTDRVENPIQALGTDPQALLAWAWIYPFAFSNGRAVFSQAAAGGTAGYRICSTRSTGAIRLEVDRATTDLSFTSSTLLLALQWQFVAYQYDIAAGTAQMFIGTRFAPVAEVAYAGGGTMGSGATVTDSGGVARWGSNTGASLALAGAIWRGGLMLQTMTLAQLREIQFNTAKYLRSSYDYKEFGVPWGTSMVPDKSGHGNTGVATLTLTAPSSLGEPPQVPPLGFVGSPSFVLGARLAG